MQARGAVEAPGSGSLRELMARLHAGPHLQERPHGTGSRRFGHRLRQLALLHFAKTLVLVGGAFPRKVCLYKISIHFPEA